MTEADYEKHIEMQDEIGLQVRLYLNLVSKYDDRWYQADRWELDTIRLRKDSIEVNYDRSSCGDICHDSYEFNPRVLLLDAATQKQFILDELAVKKTEEERRRVKEAEERRLSKIETAKKILIAEGILPS